MGYTPVFDSVFHGTLCGRWPTLPVWLTILPMADRHGHIDMTFQAMSALTGWPIELLRQAVAELMEPDPESRSESEEGRRLVLIDPENRQWGWRVVNHGRYREKARLIAKDSDRTASGRDADRKRAERASPASGDNQDPHSPHESPQVPTSPHKSPAVPLCPPASPAVPLSYSDSDSDSDSKNKSKRARKRASRAPEDFEPDRQHALAELPDMDVDAEIGKFRDWEFKTARSDWPAVWRTWIANCKESGRYAKKAGAGSKPLFLPNGKPNPEVWT